MLKSLVILIALLSVVHAQAVILNEEQFNALRYLEQSIDETVSGGKNAVNLRIIELEVQLVALKAAKAVTTDDGIRYSAVLVGAGVMGGTGALAAYLALKAYKLPVLSKHPATRMAIATIIILGGMYEVGVLAGQTSLIMVLTEAQLMDMIKKVEDRIQQLKRY